MKSSDNKSGRIRVVESILQTGQRLELLVDGDHALCLRIGFNSLWEPLESEYTRLANSLNNLGTGPVQ